LHFAGRWAITPAEAAEYDYTTTPVCAIAKTSSRPALELLRRGKLALPPISSSRPPICSRVLQAMIDQMCEVFTGVDVRTRPPDDGRSRRLRLARIPSRPMTEKSAYSQR
jgi:hypothetical protein